MPTAHILARLPLCAALLMLALTSTCAFAADKVAITIAERCNNYYASSTFRRTVTLSNLTTTPLELELDVRIGSVFRTAEALRLQAGEKRAFPIDIEVPALEEQSTAPLEFAVRAASDTVAATTTPLWLAPMSLAFFEQPPTTQTILLVGETSRTRPMLDEMGCRTTLMPAGSDPLRDLQFAVFDTGATTRTLKNELALLRQRGFFRNGGNLLVLDVGEESSVFPSIKPSLSAPCGEIDSRLPFWASAPFPRMSGILCFWGHGLLQDQSSRISNRDTRNWDLIDSRKTSWLQDPKSEAVAGELLRIREDDGAIILNGFRLLEFCRYHPAAGLVLRRLIALTN